MFLMAWEIIGTTYNLPPNALKGRRANSPGQRPGFYNARETTPYRGKSIVAEVGLLHLQRENYSEYTIPRACALGYMLKPFQGMLVLHKQKRKSGFSAASFVHSQGFEPWTHWLRVSCSTNWAKSARGARQRIDFWFAVAKVQRFFVTAKLFRSFFCKKAKKVPFLPFPCKNTRRNMRFLNYYEYLCSLIMVLCCHDE